MINGIAINPDMYVFNVCVVVTHYGTTT